MGISASDGVPVLQAHVDLSELADRPGPEPRRSSPRTCELRRLIDAERPDYHPRLERERIHLC